MKQSFDCAHKDEQNREYIRLVFALTQADLKIKETLYEKIEIAKSSKYKR